MGLKAVLFFECQSGIVGTNKLPFKICLVNDITNLMSEGLNASQRKALLLAFRENDV
jgi:hypothetical protein